MKLNIELFVFLLVLCVSHLKIEMIGSHPCNMTLSSGCGSSTDEAGIGSQCRWKIRLSKWQLSNLARFLTHTSPVGRKHVPSDPDGQSDEDYILIRTRLLTGGNCSRGVIQKS